VTVAFAAQELMERFAFDVFHHQKEDASSLFAKISHVNDVRMLNRGRGAAPRAQTARLLRLPGGLRQRARQGELFSPRPRRVIRFSSRARLHLAHRAAAETLPEA